MAALLISELWPEILLPTRRENRSRTTWRNGFYVSLYQTHVPKLEGVGIVRSDSEEKTVSLTEQVENIVRVLNHDIVLERQWAS
ncbi:DUF7344 domain-containing protein [Halobellus marinus]|uniref:DUF7344 domain-containing protein n=1 Tax=Halobellus marinus TaxID=3075123 RepID=UPI003CE46CBC